VLTEQHGGEVDLVLIGPEAAQETIRKALAMGAARATHIVVDAEAALDSMAYARILADHFAGTSYDVIACGKQAQDTDAGLTGSMLAERLGLPYATNAVGLAIDADHLVVTRQGDVGQEVIALPTPCLVTCSNDMNDPRIPTLKGIMQSKRKPIEVVVWEGGAQPATSVAGFEDIPEREPGRVLSGEVEEAVAELRSALVDEAKVL